MALVPRPEWLPLEDPPEPDPATLQEFELMAAEDLASVEPALDTMGSDFAAVADQVPADEAVSDQLGADLAAGAEELGAMRSEAEADTLAPELDAAAEQDAALEVLSGEVAIAVGESTEPPPPEPPAEPEVAPVEEPIEPPVGGGHPAPDVVNEIPMDWDPWF
jgi:hypothetical protein